MSHKAAQRDFLRSASPFVSGRLSPPLEQGTQPQIKSSQTRKQCSHPLRQRMSFDGSAPLSLARAAADQVFFAPSLAPIPGSASALEQATRISPSAPTAAVSETVEGTAKFTAQSPISPLIGTTPYSDPCLKFSAKSVLSVSTSSSVTDDGSLVQTPSSDVSSEELGKLEGVSECSQFQQRIDLSKFQKPCWKGTVSNPIHADTTLAWKCCPTACDRMAHSRQHVDVAASMAKANTFHAKITSMKQQLASGTVDGAAIRMTLIELGIEMQTLDVECVDAARFSCGPSRAMLEEIHQRLRKFRADLEKVLGQCQNKSTRLPRFSNPSGEAILILATAGEKSEELEKQFNMLSRKWASRSAPAAIIKKQLAQVEVQAKRLETDSVDGVSLVELNSGRQVAKSLRKHDLLRLEQMFANIDTLFMALSEQE